MEGFILRVTAYHGEPKKLGNVYARSGVSHDVAVESTSIVNDLEGDVVMDLKVNLEADYSIDALIEDFQDEYGCKVSYSDPTLQDGVKVMEFDVFEPSWPERIEAEDVIEDLTRRLVDWVHGYPVGR